MEKRKRFNTTQQMILIIFIIVLILNGNYAKRKCKDIVSVFSFMDRLNYHDYLSIL